MPAKKKATKLPKKRALKRASTSVWKHSVMTSFSEGDVSEDKCEVRIAPGRIWVSYRTDEGPTVYDGEETAPGHFKLLCPAQKGRASLHRFPDDDVLEGFWIEYGFQGMWRIQLIDEVE
jgi:hypothetical protein